MLGAAEIPMLNNPPISYDLCGQGQASKLHLYFKSLAQFLKNRILFVKAQFNKEMALLRAL